MPKLSCPCGYIHNLSQIPDAGWITIRDEEFDSISTSGLGSEEKLDALYSASGSIYVCPNCERLMWAKKAAPSLSPTPESNLTSGSSRSLRSLGTG